MTIATTVVGDLVQSLERIAPQRVSVNRMVLERHGTDESYHEGRPPDAVVFVESTAEVAAVVTLCAERRIPVIPFGTGTSLEGHVAALEGGVCIDFSRMNRVLEVNSSDMDCRIEPGVTRKQLNEYLRDTGLFFPVDPGADASLGGMAATAASGTNAVRYGTMRGNVLGLTLVLADGRIIKTGGRARKSAAGYDLTRLFVGSEGTLGVITELTLRLYGVPEAISAAVCSFRTLSGAVDTVIQTIQSGVPVARIELLDEFTIRAVNGYSKLGLAEAPTLFLEFHGTPLSVREQTELVGAIAAENGGSDFDWSTKPEDRGRLWQARHDAFYASLALKPGAKGWTTDVCVPISRLSECILKTRADIDASGLLAPLVGHVGDGNFHLVFLIHPDDHGAIEKAEEVNERMVDRALSMGGTCTGEHGIGYGKIKYLRKEHASAVDVMAAIKRALDPHTLMNPGKVVT